MPIRPFHVNLGLGLLVGVASLQAQPPARENRAPTNPARSALERLLTLDANKNGSLEKSEVPDARLADLFQRADANKDGVASGEELTKYLEKEAADLPPGGFGGGPGSGGDFFGPFGFGPGPGPGGPPPGGFRPERMGIPGQVLPPFLADELDLSEEQRAQVSELQREVDARLAKILKENQNRRLQEMRNRGPGNRPPPPGGGREPRNTDRPPPRGNRE